LNCAYLPFDQRNVVLEVAQQNGLTMCAQITCLHQTINPIPTSNMFALIQIENHASNKGKTEGRYQFDSHPTRIGLKSYKKDNKIKAEIK